MEIEKDQTIEEKSESPIQQESSETVETPNSPTSVSSNTPTTTVGEESPKVKMEIEEPEVKPQFTKCLGIDFGSQEVALAQADVNEPHKSSIIRNKLSHDTTSCIVSFHRNERSYGENANSKRTLVPSSCYNGFTLLMKYENNLDDFFNEYPDFCYDVEKQEDGQLYFKVNGDEIIDKVHVSHCISMLLQKMKEIAECENKDITQKTVLAVPDNLDEIAYKQLYDACILAGFTNISIASTSVCQAYSYGMKLKTLNELPENTSKNVLFVDQGHSFTDVYLVHYTPTSCKILLSDSIMVGAKNYDIALYKYFKQDIENKKKVTIKSKSKQSLRLLDSCNKLKEMLSGVSSTRITCGGVCGDDDVLLEISRAKFEDLCRPSFNRVEQLLSSFQQKCTENNYTIDTLEVVGGGCRVPYIKSLLSSLFNTSLSYTVDSASCIARGAAMLGVYYPKSIYACEDSYLLNPSTSSTYMPVTLYNQIIEVEAKLNQRDQKQQRLAAARNSIESLIGDMKSAQYSALGEKYINHDTLSSLLQEYDDYLLDNIDIPEEKLIEMKKELETKLHNTFKDYFEQVQIEKEKVEKELEAAAKKRAEEQALSGKEDHDDRKLTTAARLQKVERNKKEGNDLFKDKNYAHAANRYVQALTHCGKFFDLNEEDKKTVQDYRLSLYLNLAQCYIKLEKYDKAIDNCNYAIAIDANNVKALYRRALCYDKKKQYMDCKKDITQLLKLNAEDASVKKLAEKNALDVKKIEMKRKEMAKRMFGN
ncbi:hypothetical protein WA158_007599 [Blastocystis sp. Blastoise]